MTQVRQSNLESTDASRSDNLPLVSPGASLYPESCRNGAALGSVPTLDITSKDRPSNIAILKDAHCWQEGKRNIRLIKSSFRSYIIGGRVGKASWLSPHTAEEQKRMWYHSSLAMGEKQVADEWGFKSTSVSRSQSPHDTAEPRSAKDSRGMRRAGSL
ncbi:hypothetical protein COCSADRAFT_35831 [Bipolaris sorokiniana ND90Pr]|uniref:Uncharacterized protein n=1 Tax=Cochliobolus sativus (strain ND90Pr / ATCC 201652) TaxID=665912 RepID=M2TAA5_COCSN|nr:uncharacterized protein COCSADRAFT_35831 [Bipolaris sorokiniana ND90Pr]EMD65847.1 hypothetical protein COCSADRAFT_35831 [Bipolaris sorokiniana ND90Pr]